MKNFTLGLIGALFFIFSVTLFSKTPDDIKYQFSSAPVQNIFFQVNNIHTVFRTDGYFNYDKITFPGGDAGLIWPASSSTRLTADFATGIWIGAKVGPQRELRLAASFYNTHYSPGNIPVIGQVPPQVFVMTQHLKAILLTWLTPDWKMAAHVRKQQAAGPILLNTKHGQTGPYQRALRMLK